MLIYKRVIPLREYLFNQIEYISQETMNGYEKEPLLIEQKIGKNLAAKKDSKKMAEFKQSKWRSKAKCQGNLNSQPGQIGKQEQSSMIQEITIRQQELKSHQQALVQDKRKDLFQLLSQNKQMVDVPGKGPNESEKRSNRMQAIMKKVEEKKKKAEDIIRENISRYNSQHQQIQQEKSLQSEAETAKFNDVSSEISSVQSKEIQVNRVIKQTNPISSAALPKDNSLKIPNKPAQSQALARIRQNLLQRRIQTNKNTDQNKSKPKSISKELPLNLEKEQPLKEIKRPEQPMNINISLARNAIEATNQVIRQDQIENQTQLQKMSNNMNSIFNAQPQIKNVRNSPIPVSIHNSPRSVSHTVAVSHKNKEGTEHSLNFPLLEIMASCFSEHWPSTIQHQWKNTMHQIYTMNSSPCQQYSNHCEMVDENQYDHQAMACETIYRQKLKQDYINLCNNSQESSPSAQHFEYGHRHINTSSFIQEDHYQKLQRQRMQQVSQEVYKEQLYQKIMSLNLGIPPLFEQKSPPYCNPHYIQGYNPNEPGTPFRPTPYYIPPPYFQPLHKSSLFTKDYNPEPIYNYSRDYDNERRIHREPFCPSYRQIKLKRISEYYHEGLANRAKQKQDYFFYRPEKRLQS